MPTGVYAKIVPPWNKGLTKAEDSRVDYDRPTEFKKGHKVNLGKHHSGETKKKISDTKRGKKPSEEHIKRISMGLKGHKVSEETKRKISETQKARHASGEIVSWVKGKRLSRGHKLKIGLANRGNVGALASGWRGGKSRVGYMYEFNMMLKEKIRERDKRECAICDKGGIVIHHIDYDKSNCRKNNLITLCESCHSKTNFNRGYWEAYFSGKNQ